MHAKKSAPVFIKNVTNLLKTHDVVIADKYVLYLLSRFLINDILLGIIIYDNIDNSYATL